MKQSYGVSRLMSHGHETSLTGGCLTNLWFREDNRETSSPREDSLSLVGAMRQN
jgi:hypothetical protein